MKEYKKRFSDKVAKLLDEKIKFEAESSQIYKAMSVWFDMYGFTQLAKLYKKYSEEEREHMDKIYEYCLKRNYLPNTPALAGQPNAYSGVEEILYKTYEHEIFITESYRELINSCLAESDHVTRVLAEEILTEQIEEEDKALLLCDLYDSMADCPSKDFLLDNSKQVENLL